MHQKKSCMKHNIPGFIKRSYCATALSLGLLTGVCTISGAYADELEEPNTDKVADTLSVQSISEKSSTSFEEVQDKAREEESQKKQAAPKQGIWKRNAIGWWYEFSDGTYLKNGLYSIDNTIYHFNSSGYMSVAWVKYNNNWLYFNQNGSQATGWVKDKGVWYYLDGNGVMKSDTWFKYKGTWYYLAGSGAMKTGWLKDAGTWYYMDQSGAMQTGWLKDGATWYYLYDSGAMAKDVWIGKYYLDSSGAWTHTRQQEQRSNVHYYKVGSSLARMTDIEQANNPYIKGSNARDKILSGLDPDNFSYGSPEYYQFADLTKDAQLTAQDLDNFISSTTAGRRGVFVGKGQVFIDAARKYNINAAYLLAHAILESGWGNSTLAKGYDFDSNKGYVVDGRTYVAQGAAPTGRYYNFFGIGAIDSDPLNGGRRYAIQNGWLGIDGGIEGAAKWIATYYIYSRSYHQNTLYKMRWNAEINARDGRAVHQYASDPLWAKKIGSLMGSIYKQAHSKPVTQYLVPEYS